MGDSAVAVFAIWKRIGIIPTVVVIAACVLGATGSRSDGARGGKPGAVISSIVSRQSSSLRFSSDRPIADSAHDGVLGHFAD